MYTAPWYHTANLTLMTMVRQSRDSRRAGCNDGGYGMSFVTENEGKQYSGGQRVCLHNFRVSLVLGCNFGMHPWYFLKGLGLAQCKMGAGCAGNYWHVKGKLKGREVERDMGLMRNFLKYTFKYLLIWILLLNITYNTCKKCNNCPFVWYFRQSQFIATAVFQEACND